MKTLRKALAAVAVGAMVASAVSVPAMAQSHYDQRSQRQCDTWRTQYFSWGGFANVIRGGPVGAWFAGASYRAGSAYGAANCQRYNL